MGDWASLLRLAANHMLDSGVWTRDTFKRFEMPASRRATDVDICVQVTTSAGICQRRVDCYCRQTNSIRTCHRTCHRWFTTVVEKQRKPHVMLLCPSASPSVRLSVTLAVQRRFGVSVKETTPSTQNLRHTKRDPTWMTRCHDALVTFFTAFNLPKQFTLFKTRDFLT
jgi:hypothetical protein